MTNARTSVNENYQVVWTAEDAFDVWDGESYEGVLTLSKGAGTTSGSFNGSVVATNGMTALFPSYSGDSHKKAYTFKETYTSQETDAPMLGTFDGQKFSFSLLTAMVRVVVANVNSGEVSMTITSGNNEILTGEANLTDGILGIPASGKNSVSVNLTTTETSTITFDIPIPIQDYTNGLNVIVKLGNEVILNKTKD